MTQRVLLVALFVSIMTTRAFAQDDLMEKIKLLEQQIQELKLLKEQQNLSAAKAEQCMNVVAREKFCTCVGNNLPREISFEDYVHTLVTSNEALGYAGLTQEQKAAIDATRIVRDKCIEKGFFK